MTMRPHHPPILFGELVTIAPIAVPADSRPDGPLLRDLAGWFVAPTYSGDAVHGPHPLAVAGIIGPLAGLTDLDAVLDADTLEAIATTYPGAPVIVLATGRHESPFVVILATMLPTAWSPP